MPNLKSPMKQNANLGLLTGDASTSFLATQSNLNGLGRRQQKSIY